MTTVGVSRCLWVLDFIPYFVFFFLELRVSSLPPGYRREHEFRYRYRWTHTKRAHYLPPTLFTPLFALFDFLLPSIDQKLIKPPDLLQVRYCRLSPSSILLERIIFYFWSRLLWVEFLYAFAQGPAGPERLGVREGQFFAPGEAPSTDGP